MNDYDSEEWFGLYSLALLELERAVISGRINEARISITARLEELKTLTGSRERERDAIEGALRNLRVIEREEARLAEEDRQRILRETIQKLREVVPESSSPHILPTCPLCGKPCPIDDCVTDAQGKAVHRNCYRDALISQQQSL
jgi:hypothetical protein